MFTKVSPFKTKTFLELQYLKEFFIAPPVPNGYFSFIITIG